MIQILSHILSLHYLKIRPKSLKKYKNKIVTEEVRRLIIKWN